MPHYCWLPLTLYEIYDMDANDHLNIFIAPNLAIYAESRVIFNII